MPKLRFPGFEGEWENTELGNLAFYGKEKTRVRKNHFVSTENIEQNFGGIVPFEDSETMVDGTGFTKGDILIANIRPYLKKIWQSDMDGACNADVLVMKPQEIDNVFFYFLVAQNKFIDYVMGGVKGSKMPRGDKAHILQYNTAIPSILEQQQIAKFLSLLSNRIAAQKELIETLKKYKRGLLSAVFPGNSHVTPKYRLSGFSKPWKQRKLGDIADIKTGPFGSTLHADDYVNEGIPIITTEHFKSGKLPTVKNGIPQVSDDDYLRLKGYTLKTGDIVFSRVGSVDINALVTPIQDKWLFSGRVLRVRSYVEIVSTFLHTLLETDNVRKDIISRAVGQTMPSINTEILKATLLCLPQDIDEQLKIGSYFAHLDRIITLHQCRLNMFEKIKFGMLQQLFI